MREQLWYTYGGKIQMQKVNGWLDQEVEEISEDYSPKKDIGQRRRGGVVSQNLEDLRDL